MSYLEPYFHFLDRPGAASLLFSFIWMFTWLVVSVFFRRAKGTPIFVKVPEQRLFMERWTSGRSMRNFLTKAGGARNCLFVAVTNEGIIIHPHFPFSLGFLPEIYGLDWNIPRSALGTVQLLTGALMGKRILLEFTQDDGTAAKVELRLRDPGSFQKAIEEMRRA